MKVNEQKVWGKCIYIHKPCCLVLTLAIFSPPPAQYSEHQHTRICQERERERERERAKLEKRKRKSWYIHTSMPARELPGKILSLGNLTKSSSSVLKLAVSLLWARMDGGSLSTTRWNSSRDRVFITGALEDKIISMP